jgi:ABC-type nickel/cobalt efflux system permease component RcnA
VTIRTKHTKNPLVLGFGLTAGLGIILMIVALAFGVSAGAEADNSLISLLFVGGVALFVLGLAAWFFVVQPHKHFDDIDVPAEAEHHHEPHEIVPAEPHAVEAHHE